MAGADQARRVLIVDDEESTRLLIERILEAIPGLEATLAESGEQALKLLAERSFDLILLDLLMPGIGGIEALTRIRSSPANKNTPVIVISVMADGPTKTVCRSLGVVEYLVKPIERPKLVRAVEGALAR